MTFAACDRRVAGTVERPLAPCAAPARNAGLLVRIARAALCGFLSLVVAIALLPRVASAVSPDQGPGGPILVITSPSSTYGRYYAEILRTEGLNAFDVADISQVTSTTLAAHDVAVLAKMPLTPQQASMISTWVSGGGNLVAMGPDPQLATVLGLAPVGTSLSEAYLLVDNTTAAGAGIVNQTIQFHGTADRYTLNGASSIATLYENAASASANPAVSLNNFGSGQAAAFAYDLATSIVYSRQGNPAWATQERDGFTPIRSDDKFFGNSASDPRPDWIDLSKVAIPQADEQQRLLANLILTMNLRKKPLPRFWYFPNGRKAVVVMTGDDHGNGGTVGRFNQYVAASTPGCNVAKWECVRATSYLYPTPSVTDAQAAAFVAQGFEISPHINTSCLDYSSAALESFYAEQLGSFASSYPSVPAPATERVHCVVWSDWITGAKTELAHGIRLDTTYYFWPPSWVRDTPGLFTGSAMPMRFADLDGSLIDVYQATTQMNDEADQSYPFTVDTLLDRAAGSGYYGAYTVNAHADTADSPVADAVLASAQARSIPIISSAQLLTWLDARNNSSFGSIAWNGSALSFGISADASANDLQAMLPMQSSGGLLKTITRSGTPVSFTSSTIKGIAYAAFPAVTGSYAASYASDTTPPTVADESPGPNATNIGLGTSVRATFSEALSAATLTSNTFFLKDDTGRTIPATLAYDGGSFVASLTPSSWLAPNTSYVVTVKGGTAGIKDLAGNALASDFAWSFTTGSGPACPCSAWSSTTTPSNPAAFDTNPVELGVKFKSDSDGSIAGIRFYKGTGNTGTHVGNLWTSTGQLLASAVFTNESATGWQQVNFASPVHITANTVYVASYYAPNDNYAADQNFFATAGVDAAPIHLLASGVSGGNGVYAYGSTSTFPSNTFNATNYWVDVVFSFAAGTGGDTTPPRVTSTLPADGAVGIAANAVVTATFSEPIDPATITGTTFVLNGPQGAVAATVTYDANAQTATLAPGAALASATSYTATVIGGATDPRVKDLAGNALANSASWTFTTAAGSSGGCSAPANPIVAENCLTGNPSSDWDIPGGGVGDTTLQGFATDISVNKGTRVTFKIKSTASAYHLDIYRMGYYAGNGARRVAANVQPTATLPQSQPACLGDAATKLLDCGNWSESAHWDVPASATSGIYFAKLVSASGGSSHIFFIVRDDSSHSDILFQTSDETWQAYNNYGDNSPVNDASLYGCCGSQFDETNRGYKVSYNRPFATRSMESGVSWVFNAEYPMVRFLEANGYDVAYFTGVDAARFGNLIGNHRIYMPVGHDEYWSGPQRANVEAARNAGVNLAFFTGNGIFWKTRWENSIDGSNTPYRTLVGYKETHANRVIDPQDPPTTTASWRDLRFGTGGSLSSADGGRPENALMGTIFMVNGPRIPPDSLNVPAADGKMRFWRNTSIAAQSAGQVATLPAGTLGFEWDVDADNGFRPPGLVRMSTTIVNMSNDYLLDFGSTYGAGTANHALTLYKHPSGAIVFGAGTVQWSWGLDSHHDAPDYAAPAPDPSMRQATVNLLADMSAQPGTLQAGLLAATPSTDAVAPTSTIASPAAGASVPTGVPVTISGTAADTGGGVVGGVEVSVDGGATWHPATGRSAWTFSWTPSAPGAATLRSRAVDDSANLETPGAGVTVNVGGTDTTPPTIAAQSPAPGATGVAVSTTVTVTFSEAMNAGTLSASTFTLTGPSGPVSASVSYSASTRTATLTPSASLAASGATYTASVLGGANGVKDLAGNALAATATWSFTTADTSAPTITARSPASGATGVSASTAVTVTFSEAMNASTISGTTFTLTGTAPVSATVTYDVATRTATLTPGSTLSSSTRYTATVTGGSNGVKDVSGNPLASTSSWSFTTADTGSPTITATSPTDGQVGVSGTANVTATFSEAMSAGTINTQTFVLRDAQGIAVTATVSYSGSTRVATLNPSPTLIAGRTYTATVVGMSGGVTDLAGNPLAASRVWSFTIVADTTAPTVASVSPLDGATGVARSVKPSATFSEAMDPATVTTGTFFLTGPSGAVAATVALSSSGRVATIKPATSLSARTTYSVTVKGGPSGVKDRAGNPLAVDRVWNFTTR